jgi:hypothetical protein
VYGNNATYNNNATATTMLHAMTRLQASRCQREKGNEHSATMAKIPLQHGGPMPVQCQQRHQRYDGSDRHRQQRCLMQPITIRPGMTTMLQQLQCCTKPPAWWVRQRQCNTSKDTTWSFCWYIQEGRGFGLLNNSIIIFVVTKFIFYSVPILED